MKLVDEESFEPTEEAIAYTLRSGLSRPEQPLDEDRQPLNPKLPRDLSKVSNQRLGQLLGELTACTNYAAYLAALNDVQLTIAESELEYVTASVRMEKTGTAMVKRDKTKRDPRVRTATTHYYSTLAKAEIVKVLTANYERMNAAVSREITRRGNEMQSRTL